mgnify:FL=1
MIRINTMSIKINLHRKLSVIWDINHSHLETIQSFIKYLNYY